MIDRIYVSEATLNTIERYGQNNLTNVSGQPDEHLCVEFVRAKDAAAPSDMKEGRWCPDECPITGLEFFMWLEHPELGYVPTYGGPFDSYTLAALDEDGLLRSERYDHDRGEWIEGGHPMTARDELIVAAEMDEPEAAQPDERAAFEAWAVQNGMHDMTRHGADEYLRDPANICWLAWQAARAEGSKND